MNWNIKEDWDLSENDPQFKCTQCGDPCEVVEETFDFAGTHCTNGKGGTHHTGVYVSKCCLEDYEDI